MVDKKLRYITDYAGRLVEYTSLLVFIPSEKRWGKYNRSHWQIENDDVYSSMPYYDITPERAKEIYMDCPIDEWLQQENEDYFDWKNRIATEKDKEQIRNSKKRINRHELKIISQTTEKRDNDSEIMETTTIYECPCGKGRFFYTKEHTGFDDWYTSLDCDDCKEIFFSV